MELPPVRHTRYSQRLAAMLLDAWLSGDRYRLSWELDWMATLPRMPSDGAESDRMEILTGIACDMQRHADLFAPSAASVQIGVWMGLLDHLSDRRNAFLN